MIRKLKRISDNQERKFNFEVFEKTVERYVKDPSARNFEAAYDAAKECDIRDLIPDHKLRPYLTLREAVEQIIERETARLRTINGRLN